MSRNSTRFTRGNSRARQLPNVAVSPCVCPGCGARIMRRALDGACILRPLPLLRLAASAAGGARLRSPSTKFYSKSRTRSKAPRTQFAVKFPCRCRRRRRMSADGDRFRLFYGIECMGPGLRRLRLCRSGVGNIGVLADLPADGAKVFHRQLMQIPMPGDAGEHPELFQ